MADKKVRIQEEVDAKKRSYGRDEAWQVIAEADKVVVAVGKKLVEFDPKGGDREEMLKRIIGPSGNLRAPTLRIGRTYYVGFQPQLYEALLA